MTHNSNSRLLSYFVWVLVLSVPFYVWGVVAPVRGLPFGLPATATMIILPALVATLLTRYELGGSAAWQMWKRVGDVSRAKPVWLIAAAAIMPGVSVLAFFLMRAIGLSLPTVVSITWPLVPLMVVVYFFGAVFEEIGWTGYATSRMEPQFGVVRTGLLIGIVWAAWHVIPWWLGQGHAVEWVIGQSALTVLMRVIMVWIYSQGGQSVFASIVFHAMINTSYSVFPNNGSHYNPTVVLLPVALLVAVIAFCSRPHSRLSI